LHLKAFGPFTERVLDFGAAQYGLVLVHGLNEAGKSSALRAISDLRFGIPLQSKDNFVHFASGHCGLAASSFDRNGDAVLAHGGVRGVGRHCCFADFERSEQGSERPVPPEVDATPDLRAHEGSL